MNYAIIVRPKKKQATAANKIVGADLNVPQSGIRSAPEQDKTYKEAKMDAKDYEGMECPHCKHKESQLKAMGQYALKCFHCRSTFILDYADDFDNGRRVFLAQRQNPEFFNRARQLDSESKEWAEIYQLVVEKEGISLYSSYVLGYKDHTEMTS